MSKEKTIKTIFTKEEFKKEFEFLAKQVEEQTIKKVLDILKEMRITREGRNEYVNIEQLKQEIKKIK